MERLVKSARRYPVVLATLGVAALVIVLLALGQGQAAQWLASAFALGVAAWTTVGMVRDVLRGHWGIDILAVTAIVSTVAVGEYLASLVIVLMLSGGEALEDYAAGRARRELTSLLSRSPQTGHRYTTSTAEVTDVPVSEIRIGDTLLVRPAEVVPVDGTLTSVDAALDESALTGESMPVQVTTGDRLLSGSVNGGRALTMRVTARVEDSQYQRIVALVEEASQSRAPLVRLADRYAVPFTIASLVLAGLAWFFSGDPVRFAEVLVVATPCPLLIAAPVAFMGGMSRAARAGIIVKGGGTLEKLSRVKTVVFDKTGTLTYGQPSLEAVHPENGWSADDVLAAAASAEQYSTHVLADSVRLAAAHRGLDTCEASTASEHATNGVVAELPVGTVVVGKRSFVAQFVDDVPTITVTSGHLAIWVAINGTFAGTLMMSDRLRDDAPATVAAFRSMGADEVMMVTGDLQATADSIAAAAGLTRVHAEAMPQDKVAVLRTLERPVVMIGDGVNDAPALAAADVGIAMGARGSTAASETADVVIMADALSRTADAMAISQRTIKVALESIWLGIALSAGLMLVAAFGFLPAIVGAATQEVVDLAAILNALRALSAGRGARSLMPIDAQGRGVRAPALSDSTAEAS
ncbi:heavy metal translocating P-type ATPase [Tessaracoccus antarcticus]|uniref:Heavy metal translocating P-type ATPase n=1 Tax=Tessaracoccus antarcticus TaxID=2479848 RepID=A0A3M0GAD9_9ACTN|nr:heavy metal translocating P-type ATPase [Tessaracoccus antarcticus]RMB61951.1 heavy metal translocating P-type ATPase [Tessaracoccus antarcticus]